MSPRERKNISSNSENIPPVQQFGSDTPVPKKHRKAVKHFNVAEITNLRAENARRAMGETENKRHEDEGRAKEDVEQRAVFKSISESGFTLLEFNQRAMLKTTDQQRSSQVSRMLGNYGPADSCGLLQRSRRGRHIQTHVYA
jgi:hypothetical protein